MKAFHWKRLDVLMLRDPNKHSDVTHLKWLHSHWVVTVFMNQVFIPMVF